MPGMQAYEEFLGFIEEYTDFLQQMVKDENEKLSALQSRELSRIEHSITTAQANAKKLENYEAKRVKLQQRLGYEGMSFREIIEQAPEDQQAWLGLMFDRFERNVNEIRFRNDKSMAVARDSMMDIDPEAALPVAAMPQKANPYRKIRDDAKEQSSLLETKV